MNEENKSKKGIIAAIAVLLVLVVAAGGLYLKFGKQKTSAGNKQITVTVVHQDLSEKDFVYETDAEYLGDVITTEGLVEGSTSDYGLYITSADGEAADEAKQQWWCITKDGEMVNTSADQTPIADGDKYELTFTEGY